MPVDFHENKNPKDQLESVKVPYRYFIIHEFLPQKFKKNSPKRERIRVKKEEKFQKCLVNGEKMLTCIDKDPFPSSIFVVAVH